MTYVEIKHRRVHVYLATLPLDIYLRAQGAELSYCRIYQLAAVVTAVIKVQTALHEYGENMITN